jgi:hypothetical protein
MCWWQSADGHTTERMDAFLRPYGVPTIQATVSNLEIRSNMRQTVPCLAWPLNDGWSGEAYVDSCTVALRVDDGL